jgi:ribonuclease HII
MRQLELFNIEEYRDELQALKGQPETIEQHLREQGYTRILGIDEVGRGPLAGPVVSCACLLPHPLPISGLTDSKLLNEEQIEELYFSLIETPGVEYAVSVVEVEIIDKINILQAALQAMREAAQKIEAEIAIVDGTIDPALATPILFLAKADQFCPSVSAASIIAKYSRDQLMRSYDKRWPEYGFAENKGYGTSYHIEQLNRHGPSPIHRRSFGPLKKEDNQLTLL